MAVSVNKCIGDEADPDSVVRDFLRGLPPEVQKELSCNTRHVAYCKGSSIRLLGARPRPGIVLEGLIRAYVSTAGGREVTVAYARPGYPLGLFSRFMAESPRGLQAVHDTTVLYFDSRRFEQALATHMALADTVAEWMADDIVRSSNALRAAAFGSVRHRLAAHLIALATRDAEGRLVVRVTRQQLADAVGSVRQVVSKALSQLATDGLVRTARSEVLIPDEDALRREAAQL
jgi:CRP/FNR family cyclic AMP-dependent transcriptional regulator